MAMDENNDAGPTNSDERRNKIIASLVVKVRIVCGSLFHFHGGYNTHVYHPASFLYECRRGY